MSRRSASGFTNARAIGLGAAAVAIAVVAIALHFSMRRRTDDVSCAPGFVVEGARCLVYEGPGGGDCPAPLARSDGGDCLAPPRKVRIPASRFVVGPSDWEAEGRVRPRTIALPAFEIDAFEASRERGIPVTQVTRDEAAALCAKKGGRLPTEDEWIAAAASGAPNGSASRYPWGDTGAVCRRAAWGVLDGPCHVATRGRTGDALTSAAGSHPDGDTPLGVHDMAGNVAEWVVTPDAARGVAHGGSWASSLATELRTWSRLELDPGARDRRVGFRCAYDLAPSPDR